MFRNINREGKIQENGNVYLPYSFMRSLELVVGSKLCLLPVKNIIVVFEVSIEDGSEGHGFASIFNEDGEINLPDELLKRVGWKVGDDLKLECFYKEIGYFKPREKEVFPRFFI